MKTACEELFTAAHLLVERELGPKEARELKEHIENCIQCSETLQELTQIKSILEESLSARITLPDEDSTVRRVVATVFLRALLGKR